MQSSDNTIVVWDPFVRVFHWSLVAAYIVAWATAEERLSLHESAGYFVMILIGLRLVWGVMGTRYARFSDFVTRPTRAIDYLKALFAGRPRRYLGHNPAGGWMIVALLLSVVLASVTGLLMSGGVAGGLVAGGEVWEEVHEGAAGLSLLLIVVHVSGVIVSSLVHRENLVRAMLSGRKTQEETDV